MITTVPIGLRCTTCDCPFCVVLRWTVVGQLDKFPKLDTWYQVRNLNKVSPQILFLLLLLSCNLHQPSFVRHFYSLSAPGYKSFVIQGQGVGGSHTVAVQVSGYRWLPQVSRNKKNTNCWTFADALFQASKRSALRCKYQFVPGACFFFHRGAFLDCCGGLDFGEISS